MNGLVEDDTTKFPDLVPWFNNESDNYEELPTEGDFPYD
jgi:hypothetical protein